MLQRQTLENNSVNVMSAIPNCKAGKGDEKRSCNIGDCMKGEQKNYTEVLNIIY